MKNILYLTLLKIDNLNQRGLYTDLVRELSHRGLNVYVVCPRQRRLGLSTEVLVDGNVHLLQVRTGNITTANMIEKGLSTILIGRQYQRAIDKYFAGVKFDLILYSTPPITFETVVRHYKMTHHAKTYLMLKDIFPQNAVDLGLLRRPGFLWWYFRKKEKRLYTISDVIGCMSPANVRYLLHKNPYLDVQKVEVFPNSIRPIPPVIGRKNYDLLAKYGIPSSSVLFIYGGNLGKPQGIDFLLSVVDAFHEVPNSFLLIVGSGTEFRRIRNHLEVKKPSNVRLIGQLPKSEYDELLESSDVGLIFLDRRFTIPNFPSRLTSYMEYSLPVLAATDKNTDLKDILLQSESGYWCESGDLKSFIKHATELACNSELRSQMGENARAYLEEHYDVSKTIDILLKHL